jgi:hypothetical protein
MKPTVHIPPIHKRIEVDFPRTTHWSKALLSDYNFQGKAGDPYGWASSSRGDGENSRSRSIYVISREFFREEMHRDFFVEGIAFAAIVLVSAWPLATMVLLLARLIK